MLLISFFLFISISLSALTLAPKVGLVLDERLGPDCQWPWAAALLFLNIMAVGFSKWK
jgi:hypothetical protein